MATNYIDFGDKNISTSGSIYTANIAVSSTLGVEYLNITKRYTETVATASISSSSVTLNLNNSNLFITTLNSNITTITISNIPSTSGTAIGFTWILTADGTARTITWPGTIKWVGGTAPTLTSTNNKKDVLSFLSTDNGTTWLGFVGGQNY